MPRRRTFLYLPLSLLVFSVVGGLVAAPSGEDDIQNSLKTFTSVYSVIESNFADRVDPDKAIYGGAITSMLRTLDPHSGFYDPKLYRLLQEDQRGHYFGVGMLVGARSGGRVFVQYPFTGSPAADAGVHPGDVITAINGKSAIGLTTSQVADQLKGPRGTPVEVTVERPRRTEPLKFTIVRNAIPRASVQNAFHIRPGIAYLRIESFNENTGKEFEEALRLLDETRLQGLVLDLRGNPGGLLKEGVAVADRFLAKGQMIVSHRGRASAERPYVSRRGNTGREYPIVVLVDRSSASAAEIVAGALQDHDRAWILGDNTFGKGLVQSQFPLSGDTALLLTTAKYYTPSGRLIQRDYTKGSFYEYYARRNSETKNPLDVKATDSGRTVYGGGGIAPDEKFEPEKLSSFQTTLLQKDAFFNFAAWYFGAEGARIPKDFTPGENILTEFHGFLLDKKIEFTEADFTLHRDWLRDRLRVDMYITGHGKDAADRVAIQIDPEVAQAIRALPKAKALLEEHKNVIAKRGKQAVAKQPSAN
jgi:carboxyl-terminal processing protease